MRKYRFLSCCLAVEILTMCGGAGRTQTTPQPIQLNANYKVTKRFHVPGEGGWDYVTIDSKARRLYVSHGDLIQVLNADSGKLIGQIPAPGAHGVALVPELHRGFTSNGGDKSVTVFDTRTLAVIKTVKLNSGTDNIVYEPFSKRVFALSDRATAIDPSTNEIVGTVDLGAAPEGAASDGKGSLYIAVPKQHGIAVVDPKGLSVLKTFSTGPHCPTPRTVLFDPVDQHLFVGCQGPFIIMDPNAGKVVGGSLLCSVVDSAAYDPQDKLIFEACSEGVITVLRQMTQKNFRTVATIPTRIWAKNMAFDPVTKNIYLPVADFEFIPNPPAPPNRVWKPGTFVVLVATKK